MNDSEVPSGPAQGAGGAVSQATARVELEARNGLVEDSAPHDGRIFDDVEDGLERPRQRVLSRLRSLTGERVIGQLLRGGAVLSGAMFAGSLLLEALPQTQDVSIAIDTLRKSAASVLLVTPVARVVAAGAMLGVRGEWRYTLFAGGILVLLAVAVGAGMVAH